MTKNPFQKFQVRIANGESVFEEGDSGTTMFIVQSGSVRLFREVDGQRHDLGLMEKGDFFGEMSVLEGLSRTHSASAAEDCELIEINSTTFDKMIRANIEIAVRMLRKLSIRLREAERKVDRQGGSSAELPSSSAVNQTQQIVSEVGIRLVCNEPSMTYQLSPSETLVGRYDPVTEVRPDVDLTEVDLKRSVSRRHARIIEVEGDFSLIEEVGALNGTFINGDQLTPGEPRPIQEGDEVSFGMVRMVFKR